MDNLYNTHQEKQGEVPIMRRRADELTLASWGLGLNLRDFTLDDAASRYDVNESPATSVAETTNGPVMTAQERLQSWEPLDVAVPGPSVDLSVTPTPTVPTTDQVNLESIRARVSSAHEGGI